jgi:hypothetical protein
MRTHGTSKNPKAQKKYPFRVFALTAGDLAPIAGGGDRPPDEDDKK